MVHARRARRIRRRRLTALAAAAAILVVLLRALLGGGGLPGPPPATPAQPAPAGDPFAYRPSRAAAFAQRAAAGTAQVLFLKSPGGVMATARRVARYRPLIDAAVRGSDIPAAELEGLVFLESAGRADAIAGSDVADAAGLTQILAGTGQSLLGMHIDLARSRALTNAIARATLRGHTRQVVQLQRERAQADARFDPRRALAATVRYLAFAQRYLQRVDLAIAAYHAGVGNIQHALALYDGGAPVPYAQLFFDTGPGHHAAAYAFLRGLGDDSAFYLWRVLEAERIMDLYRTDRPALRRLAARETAFPSQALALAPSPARFANPAALAAAYRRGALVPLPRNAAALHLAYAPSIGELAPRLGARRALYRGLSPSAAQMLVEIAALVDRLAHSAAPLTVTSAVLDARYNRRLGVFDPPATTGQTFQILRRYAPGQAGAFQFVLDRLQALDLIAWLRGSRTIEITVSPDAAQVIRHGV